MRVTARTKGLHALLLPGTLLLFATACGEDGPGTDGGGGAADAAPPVACNEPDRVCPAEQPLPGAPCEGDLACTYPADLNPDPWMYSCLDGAWDADILCPPGGCPAPPLAERCGAPFAGTAPGALVEIGPDSTTAPFRPFAEDEAAELVWGGQGSAMLLFRLRITGADALSCIDVTTRLSSDADPPAEVRSFVTVRCGHTLGIYTIVPWDVACDMRLFHATIDVEVGGVGSATATVSFMGGDRCFG